MKAQKFGSREFFLSYITNQLEKDDKSQQVIHRVHFAMSHFIFENFKGKEAFNMLQNLNDASETLSKSLQRSW